MTKDELDALDEAIEFVRGDRQLEQWTENHICTLIEVAQAYAKHAATIKAIERGELMIDISEYRGFTNGMATPCNNDFIKGFHTALDLIEVNQSTLKNEKMQNVPYSDGTPYKDWYSETRCMICNKDHNGLPCPKMEVK